MQEEKEFRISYDEMIYQQVQDLGKRMDRMERRMDKLEERLDTTRQELNQRMDKLEAKLEKQDEKIEKLADKIDALRRDLTGGNQHNQILTATGSASLVALVVSLLLK